MTNHISTRPIRHTTTIRTHNDKMTDFSIEALIGGKGRGTRNLSPLMDHHAQKARKQNNKQDNCHDKQVSVHNKSIGHQMETNNIKKKLPSKIHNNSNNISTSNGRHSQQMLQQLSSCIVKKQEDNLQSSQYHRRLYSIQTKTGGGGGGLHGGVHTTTMKKQRPKKFHCPYCKVAFSNNGQLRGHIRIHTGERPFGCDFVDCGKTFTRNEELTRHKRIHSGQRPFSCTVCGRGFGRKDHLKKHSKIHNKHNNSTTALVGLQSSFHHQSTKSSSSRNFDSNSNNCNGAGGSSCGSSGSHNRIHRQAASNLNTSDEQPKQPVHVHNLSIPKAIDHTLLASFQQHQLPGTLQPTSPNSLAQLNLLHHLHRFHLDQQAFQSVANTNESQLLNSDHHSNTTRVNYPQALFGLIPPPPPPPHSSTTATHFGHASAINDLLNMQNHYPYHHLHHQSSNHLQNHQSLLSSSFNSLNLSGASQSIMSTNLRANSMISAPTTTTSSTLAPRNPSLIDSLSTLQPDSLFMANNLLMYNNRLNN